ncbi:MAG: LCP family protein, partial [Anaerococcus vaginalis]|nr:LCP family protein [Anaerococcus vaginalis]
IETYFKDVKTNVPFGTMVDFANNMSNFSSDKFKTYTVPGEASMIDGVSYYIPDEKATKELRSQLNSSNLSGRKNVIPSAARGDLSIKVLNCTKINGLAANVQKQLNENGYDKVDVGNGDPREKSEILIKDESSRAFMENDLKIENIKKGISSKYDGNGTYDVVILLGKDFKNFGEMK